jgi:hypothetical protein
MMLYDDVDLFGFTFGVAPSTPGLLTSSVLPAAVHPAQ